MKTSTLIRLSASGTSYKLAQALGISRQAISKWRGNVPATREAQVRQQFPQWFKK